MAETTGKCTNFASCTLAYRNQPIPYSGNPVCPECGQPLTVSAPGGGRPPAAVIGALAAGLMLIGGGLFFFLSRHSAPPQVNSQNSGVAQARPPQRPTDSLPPSTDIASTPPNSPAPDPTTPGSTTPANPPPSLSGEDKPAPSVTPEVPSVTPPPPSTPAPSPQTIAGLMPAPAPSESDTEPVSVEKNIDTNTKGGENQRVKSEVLKRIDAMPNLSSGDKEKLYARVDRAHGMGKVITIPFAMGARAVGAREVEQLTTALKAPQVASLIKDPTVVFVLLGFADKRGDEKINQKISLDRAENISQTLKDKCGMQNVTQPVGMGGSALFDSGNFAKNRVVEVWAVVP